MRDIKKALEKQEQIKADKKTFEEPKLTFIEPKLTKQGDATKITGQPPFFQSFMP